MASSPVPRSHSRASFYSTTTYHSFQDIESHEMRSPSEKDGVSSARSPQLPDTAADGPVRRAKPYKTSDDLDDRRPSTFHMVRQDSGYESSTPTPYRSSKLPRRQRNSKKASPSPARADKTRQRPSLRRACATLPGGPISHVPGRSSLTLSRPGSLSLSHQQQQALNRKHSYFQFPSPEHLDGVADHQSGPSSNRPSIDLAPVILKVNTANANNSLSGDSGDDDQHHHLSSSRHPSSSHSQHHHHPDGPYYPLSPLTAPPPPPQTTHYWTSDRTRRLEYAAIDAAGRGVRGWVMRNIVPECFVPRESRFRRQQQHVGFDDDGGSVRRYRLDLEIECPEDAVPPSPVGEQPRGFRARAGRAGWWARLRGAA